MLLLARDTMHVVIAHRKGVRSRLIVRSCVGSRCACQTIQWVIRVTVAHLSACLATLWEWSIVLNTEYVTHGIIAVGIVHDSTCLSIHHKVLKSATLWVVGVERLRPVAVLQVGALLKLIITYLVHIVVAIGLVTTDVVYLSAEVVVVGDLLLVGIDHLQQAVVAVVLPLRDIGSDGLVGHNQRAHGLQDLTHLAVVILDGTAAVLTKHQSADTVVRRVDTTVMVLHVIFRMVGIVDSRQTTVVVLVID